MYLDPALTVFAIAMLALSVVLLRSTKALDGPKINIAPMTVASEPMTDADRDRLLAAIRSNPGSWAIRSEPDAMASFKVVTISGSPGLPNRVVVSKIDGHDPSPGDTLVVSRIIKG